MEIKTVSEKLAEQIFLLLQQNGFLVRLRKTQSTYCIYLSGVAMLQKWIKEIGFTNERTKTRYSFWKKYGYYIPNMKQQERIKKLNLHNQS